jgi:hypothetical protein
MIITRESLIQYTFNNLSPGEYNITSEYLGNDYYNLVSYSLSKFIIIKASSNLINLNLNNIYSGTSETITITLTSNNKIISKCGEYR